jgi:hypothetical protein
MAATWPLASVLIVAFLVLGWMFAQATDASTQQQVLGYFDRLIPFIIGASAGAVAGAAGGYWVAKH